MMMPLLPPSLPLPLTLLPALLSARAAHSGSLLLVRWRSPAPFASCATSRVWLDFSSFLQKIYEKIQQGVFDVSNESFGIKVGMANTAAPGTAAGPGSAASKSSGCC